MFFSDYTKRRIVFFHSRGHKAPTIRHRLREEGIDASRECIHRFIQRYKLTGCIQRKRASGRPSKVTSEVRKLVDDIMEEDDETTAHQIHRKLQARGFNLSLRTILRCRKALGWNYRGSAYCQMIRQANKAKRLEWAQQNQSDNFEDVIWTDESTIQMETHRRFCCRKKTQKPRYKPR
jgi:transposase